MENQLVSWIVSLITGGVAATLREPSSHIRNDAPCPGVVAYWFTARGLLCGVEFRIFKVEWDRHACASCRGSENRDAVGGG